MADTDFYTFANCQSYSPDILAGDQVTVDKFGASATEEFKNQLLQYLGSIPTGASITADMKAAVDFLTVSMFKRFIKDYRAQESWLADYNRKLNAIKEEAVATPSDTNQTVVYSSSYRSSQLKGQ